MKDLIRITGVKENPDGSATLNIRYGEALKEVVKSHYNKKKCDKKLGETVYFGSYQRGN